MPLADRLERLTDLVLVLLATPRPIPLEAIAQEVPGYPSEQVARRQAFERDKRLLRDEGIPVITEAVQARGQYGYRIDPESFYLPDLALTADEQAALHLAVAGVQLSDPGGRQALLKLGATGPAAGGPVASVVTPPVLPALFAAVRERAAASFHYRGDRRQVALAGLWFRGGRWYVVGWDLDRQAARTFRVDRIDGELVASVPGSGALPEGFDAGDAVPDQARAGEGDDDDVTVEVDRVEAGRVIAEVGERAITARHRDGSVSLRLGAPNTVALRSWVLGLLDHARVTEPAAFRDELVAWLGDMVEPPPEPTVEPSRSRGGRPARSGDSAGGSRAVDPPAPARPGRDAARRLRRLLAVVGWLAKVGEAPIVEISERFGIPRDELVRELELAACCGVPPYTPDALMEIVVTERSVKAFLPPGLARPRRLTPAEGFAISAAGRTILAVPGADHSGALATALEKLEQALGARQSLDVRLDDPVRLSDVRAAAADHHQIEIEYHSASTDETTERIVDPIRVVSLEGHWYLDAHCHRAGDTRRFRIDRIQGVKPTGAVIDTPLTEPPATLTSFVPGPGAITVQLSVHGDAAWLSDSLPATAVEHLASGEVLITLFVGGTAWLERLLLQLGPRARVVEPAVLRALGPAAARRVLARYQEGAPAG